MKRQRKTRGQPHASSAQKKLGRLLATESELETMLAQTRAQAAQIVEAAREEAEQRITRFDASLESETDALRARVEHEREETIASVRGDAERRVAGLDGLDEASVDLLAEQLLSLLLGETHQEGGPS